MRRRCGQSAHLAVPPTSALSAQGLKALAFSNSFQRMMRSVGFPSLHAGPRGSIAGRRHGHIRCWLGHFQVVRMRRADGAALAVRRERLVSRSSLTLEPPLVVAPVGATAGGPLGISCQHPPEFPRIVYGSPRPCDASHGPSNTRLRFSPGRFRRRPRAALPCLTATRGPLVACGRPRGSPGGGRSPYHTHASRSGPECKQHSVPRTRLPLGAGV